VYITVDRDKCCGAGQCVMRVPDAYLPDQRLIRDQLVF
jgi:ferredoxin